MGGIVVESGPDMVTVTWPDGARHRFNVLWLRDNCPSAGDRDNAFRTFSVVDLDPDLRIVAARTAGDRVHVGYSDGHASSFDLEWLRSHAGTPDGPAPIELWRSTDTLVELDAVLIDPGSSAHLELLDTIARRGAAVVHQADTSEEGTAWLAGLFGHIRETDFGRLFDIVLEPEAWTKSQTGHALDPHTDDPYRYTPSGASVLHCVTASAGGGDSVLVDGFAVADELRRTEPDLFEMLTQTPVPFIRHRRGIADQGEDVHLVAHAPVIALDATGAVCGIRFHERSMGVLDLDPDETGDYYRALIRFTSMVVDPSFAVVRRLGAAEALMFDNQRVLHGRTAFEDAPGRRHLRLCTVDRDQFHSRLRRLREDHGRSDADGWLPAGNLS